MLVNAAAAADLPLKAPAAADTVFNWTGFYIGGHFGYAAGRANWLATDVGAAAPVVSESFDLFNEYDAFKGTGSYFAGLQAGYNYLLPSHWLIGLEADISAPNTLAGSQTISTPLDGQANYSDTVLQFGTARARLGYAFDRVLVYGTGGLAWTYDKLERTQLVGGNIGVGTTEAALLWRWGWAAGAGIEFPVAPSWTAKVEYLATGFGGGRKLFPAAGQSFDSDLSMQSLRVGLNYQLGGDLAKSDVFTKGVQPLEGGDFAVHGQATFVEQYAAPFRAPYAGQNSLAPNAGRETFDLDLYVGYRPWKGAEIWIDPEIDQGFGLSGTFGVAGFPSAEAYKVGQTYPYARIPRTFLRQTIDLGGESQKVDAGINQFAGSQTADRLVITVGKFSVVDIFDQNKYAHDPRGDFLNWTAVNTGAFDYAADAWAFTYGSAVEWYTGQWTFRAGVFDGSVVPNSSDLDPNFGQFQMVGEIERRYSLWDQPGKVLVTGYLTRARLGSFQDAVNLAAVTGAMPDLSLVRTYTSRTGITGNIEQQIMDGVGLFARAGYTPGNLETYAFTDVDETVAGGASLSGKLWGRSDDTLGIVGIVNMISKEHQAYLAAGGLTALIGDGMLPHPGPEQIMEVYYQLPVYSWQLTLDYQFITNPAYNRDRGPVSVVATRLHAQF
ncbi:MAG: carbohydrate porin [Bradyrhizobium sp.]|uniref:carbohydrate porin n=1 Tax=Bradyrhizobium sp. TaxID=376 RepID=UPI001C2983D4|nr:carbohydrate porin [Bradyrhizobium sp.]MBU6463748.1 carbohydrate porin [Pseudomonadota bacterium]MDE2069366.1 carbohydrate porin [Bradyrhizobium sp.]